MFFYIFLFNFEKEINMLLAYSHVEVARFLSFPVSVFFYFRNMLTSQKEKKNVITGIFFILFFGFSLLFMHFKAKKIGLQTDKASSSSCGAL